jgi:hypothetical protein
VVSSAPVEAITLALQCALSFSVRYWVAKLSWTMP